MSNPAHPGWPALHTIVGSVCADCLDGKPGECHTPGCAFWMADAPGPAVVDVLRRLVDR